MAFRVVNGRYVPAVSGLRAASGRASGVPAEEGFEGDSLDTLKGLGLKTLSGIGMAGSFLDIPGAATRDILAGKLPFADWEGAFTSEGRTTGREMLTEWGLTDKNDPDKWEVADFAGFAAEVATDPLTILTPFGLTKAGKVIKAAGLIDEVPRVAASKLGVGSGASKITSEAGKTLRPSAPGWIKSRMMTNIGDVIHYGPEEAKVKIAKAAADMGIELTEEVTGQNIGALVTVGLPFTQGVSIGKSAYLGTEYDEPGKIAARAVKRVEGPNRAKAYSNLTTHLGKEFADNFMPVLDIRANQVAALGSDAIKTPDDYMKSFVVEFGELEDVADMDALLQGGSRSRRTAAQSNSAKRKIKEFAAKNPDLKPSQIAQELNENPSFVHGALSDNPSKYGTSPLEPDEYIIVDNLLAEKPEATMNHLASELSSIAGREISPVDVQRAVIGTKMSPSVRSLHRKIQISNYLEGGMSAKQIAETLGINQRTVSTAISRSGGSSKMGTKQFRYSILKKAAASKSETEGLDHLLHDQFVEILDEINPESMKGWDQFIGDLDLSDHNPEMFARAQNRQEALNKMSPNELAAIKAADAPGRTKPLTRNYVADMLGVSPKRLDKAIKRHQARITKNEGRLFQQQQHADQFGAKASFHVDMDKGKRVITLFKSADASSGIHEFGHMFWDDMERFGDHKLLKEAGEALGVDEAVGWTTENHEAFARQFERYVRDGVAPTASLRTAFDKFRAWMIAIYETVTGTPLEKKVSPEMKQVFDSLLGGGHPGGWELYKPTGLEKVAGGLEAIGGSIRWSKPGMLAANIFDASTGDRSTKFSQLAHKSLYRAKAEGDVYAKQKFSKHVQSLVNDGKITKDHGDILREYSEGIRDMVNATGDEQVLANVAMQAQDEFIKIKEVSDDYGIPLEELEDAWVEYFPRFISESLGGARDKSGRPMVAFDPSQLKREDALRNIKGGTVRVNKIVSLFKNADDRKILREGTTEEVIAHIRSHPELSDSFDIPGAVPLFGGEPAKINDKQARAFVKYLKKQGDDLFEAGLFANHPLVDMMYRVQNHRHAVAAAESVMEMMSDPGLMARGVTDLSQGKGAVSFNEIFNTSKLVQGDVNKGAMQKLARRLGKSYNSTEELKAFFDQRFIPAEEAEQIRRMIDGFTTPKPVGTVMELFDSATNLFKTGVTSIWPAFHTRNLMSGQFQNWLTGQFSAGSVADAHKIMRGGVASGLKGIPSIARRLKEEGFEATDEAATDLVRRMAFEHSLVHRYQGLADADVPIQSTIAGKGINREFAGGLGGLEPFSYGDMARKALGVHDDVVPLYKPHKARVRGVGKVTDSTLGPVAAGEDAGHIVEAMNRMSPFIHNLKKGMDPGEAAKRVKAAQVDYSAKEFTKTERAFFKRLFPFYSFSSRIAANTFKQLATQPGGRLAQVLRATRKGSASSVSTPDYVAQTASIPIDDDGYISKMIGTPPEGTDRYLTGIGMMHEDPLSMVSNSFENSIVELLSRTNPMVKGVLEWGTGQSFFQRGPLGGRPIEDLDPTIARTISNIGELAGGERVRKPQPFINRGVEFTLSNSPIARALTSVRVATDPRKSIVARAVNLMSGARISDISPGAKDAIIKEALEKLMKESGASEFHRIYFREAEKARMSPGERAFAEKLQSLINALAERAKNRKEASLAAASN